jgi:hypothetical protein
MNPIREDYITIVIRNHYFKSKNFNLEEIMDYFSGENKVSLDEKVLEKRIEKIKNEIEGSNKKEN